MATLRFSDLEWALATNTYNLQDLLFNTYKDKLAYLKYLNDLIRFLREHGCSDIQEKLKHISDLLRFRSIRSELEIAKGLIQRNKSVDLLPENYMGMVSPPDLLAVDDEIEAYIEVKRILEDQTTSAIIEFLRRFLRENNYHYIINVVLNEMMSIPVIKWHERRLKEEVIRKALQEFEAKIKTLDPTSLPAEIETNIGKFEIHPSTSGRGFPGVIRTSFIKLPEKKMIEKIRQDVIEKASKRDKWIDEHQAKIYIVALDFEELAYDKDYLEIALIGHRVYVKPPLQAPIIYETNEVQHAKELGWEQFLRETCIIPTNRTYLDSNRKGIFFTEPIIKNVSGVIGKFREELHFVPNPFSFDEINDPRLVNYI
jgi:hypothetical protein